MTATGQAAATVRTDAPRREPQRPRGWLVRRVLLAADLVGLSAAFALATAVFGGEPAPVDPISPTTEFVIFVLTLPVWVVAGKLKGLYARDEERADHSTVDEFAGVFQVVTIGMWIVFASAWVTGLATPNMPRVLTFWLLAVVGVVALRAAGRAAARRSRTFAQKTLIVGAGEVGQLVARKILQHPEYGIHLLGFVDERPKRRREGLERLAVLGAPSELDELVQRLGVGRVIIAFSNEPEERIIAVARSLGDREVQIDVVPRLFELVGPNVGVHTLEGLPLVSLPPVNLSPSSRLVKRSIDVVGAALGLLLTAPLFAFIAIKIKRDSPGPIFFRQRRLGAHMREFTALKFRTMRVDTDPDEHRRYIKEIMSSRAVAGSNGLYKLERGSSVTKIGRWLRKTSLDELPQLINVLRGDMSLVGPRPCLAYETEHFAPHHFERFLVPAGLTGLWQVTARAHSSFGEALDMDVAYARGWSLGLDLRLLFRTPVQVLRQQSGTA